MTVERKQEFTCMRRDDRAQDDSWIENFLADAHFGVLATIHEGQPFQNINIFVYDKETHALYMHTAKRGRTRSNIDSEERVSFSAAKMGRLLPADVARELSVEFQSVIVFGRGSIVDDKKLARDKMQKLIDKYFSHLEAGKDYRKITPAEIDEINVYRIDIDCWSGKKKKAEDDFPGAFFMNQIQE